MSESPVIAYAIRRVETPLGPFVLAAHAGGLSHSMLAGAARLPCHDVRASGAERVHLDAASTALAAYFAGAKDPWDGIVLAPEGTGFQRRVWDALRGVPYGATISYRQLANAVGSPRAARAVGQANHHNPLAVIVPCHRVVAADGSLGGYAGGLERKRWLLRHESTHALAAPPPASCAEAAGGLLARHPTRLYT